jgi:hypothetical protein
MVVRGWFSGRSAGLTSESQVTRAGALGRFLAAPLAGGEAAQAQRELADLGDQGALLDAPLA